MDSISISQESPILNDMVARESSKEFLALLNANKGIIFKVANSYCSNAENRKDLVQEIIIRIWQAFDRYNDQYKFSTWIYRIALNTAISFYRKESRRKEIPHPISQDLIEFAEGIGEGEAETDSNIIFLKQFISELKEIDRALMLLYLEERPYKEIAEIMGISESNVATKISRIKSVLKQKFSTIKATTS